MYPHSPCTPFPLPLSLIYHPPLLTPLFQLALLSISLIEHAALFPTYLFLAYIHLRHSLPYLSPSYKQREGDEQLGRVGSWKIVNVKEGGAEKRRDIEGGARKGGNGGKGWGGNMTVHNNYTGQ